MATVGKGWYTTGVVLLGVDLVLKGCFIDTVLLFLGWGDFELTSDCVHTDCYE